MKIIGTNIHMPYEDSSFLTLLINESYNSISMNFSFDEESLKGDLIEGGVVFKITRQHTTQKPGEYFYEIVGYKDGEKTTLVKKSSFVIEETARYAAGITETENLLEG